MRKKTAPVEPRSVVSAIEEVLTASQACTEERRIIFIITQPSYTHPIRPMTAGNR